jgi:hypothetical protein
MRRMLAIAYAVSTVVLAGCGSDSSTAPTQALLDTSGSVLIGTWNLTTVNGAALPLVLQDMNPKIELMSDRLVLTADGKFTQTMTARFSDGVSEMTQDYPYNGTYSLSGTSALFKFTDGTSGSGAFSGNTISVGGSGTTFVYQRQ